MRRLDESTRVFRVFISSPGDVALERDRARQVVARLEKEMAGRVRLLPVLWEDLPLMADMSFQQGIDLVLSSEHGVDIAVFILWSRLGSPLGALVQKADGEPYRSGTEREFDLMLLAREASGCERPYILAYVRDDETGFKTRLQDCPGDALEEMVRQRRLAGEFIRETFHDQDSGTNIRAFHLYNRPTDFASRLTAHLRALLHEMAPGAAGAAGTWIGEPYRGLEFFDVDHAPIFFGREEEACEIQARLQRQADRGCAFVLLLGSSGSGKSSLARAGVIPLLLAPEGGGDVHWVHTVWTPGENPEGLCLGLAKALARALPGLLCDVGGQDDLAGVLARDPDAAFCLGIKSALASEGKKEAGSRTLALLVVDQLEEAFTHGAFSPQDRENFFAALESLAQTGRFQVLATARSDFYAHLQSSPALMRMKEGEGQFDLLPPGPANVQRIISLPAAMAGVVFEKNEAGEGLDQRILNHMAKNPEALPLLEYALRDLYAHRNPEGWLTFSAYEAMGGVEGALGRRAEEVLDGLPEDARRALPRVLHALAGVEEEGEGGVVRRRASREAACPAGEEGAAQLVEALVAARLVIAERDVLYVAHEALLHQWDRAAAWINENRDRLRIRRRVEESRARWEADARPDDRLLPQGRPLAEAESLVHTQADLLEPALADYIDRSGAFHRSRERRARRIRQTVIVVLSFITLLALHLWGQAIQARYKAEIATEEAVRAGELTEVARKKAVTAQKETETLVNNMTNKLRDGLKNYDPLAALGGVIDLVDAYYVSRGGEHSAHLKNKKVINYLRDQNLAAAEEESRKASALDRRLAANDQENIQGQWDPSVSHNKRGDLLPTQGDLSGAGTPSEVDLPIARTLAEKDPENSEGQRDLSMSHNKRGGLSSTQGDLSGAKTHIEADLVFTKTLPSRDPEKKSVEP